MNLNNDVAIGAAVSSRTWTVAKVLSVAALRSDRADYQLIEIFTVLDDLANRADREARAFIEALALRVGEFEERIAELTITAHFDTAFAGSWMLLLRGTAQSLLLGDLTAAARARTLTQLLASVSVAPGLAVPLQTSEVATARAEIEEWLRTQD